ncbi:hypothetical protein L3i20_v212710 [Paenibacillus sp. L3-i20]|nr:hypothetical protein L3i20_v212710 [Paenibacillus sp. L3-i20]
MKLLRNIDGAKWMLKRLFCCHKWERVTMYAVVRCPKCGKHDTFCPW